MVWTIEFTSDAAKQLEKIGKENAKRVRTFLRERVQPDPRQQGEMLKGSQREFWRYRVGDYRILAHIEDTRFVVLVVKLGHRKEIYR